MEEMIPGAARVRQLCNCRCRPFTRSASCALPSLELLGRRLSSRGQPSCECMGEVGCEEDDGCAEKDEASFEHISSEGPFEMPVFLRAPSLTSLYGTRSKRWRFPTPQSVGNGLFKPWCRRDCA